MKNKALKILMASLLIGSVSFTTLSVQEKIEVCNEISIQYDKGKDLNDAEIDLFEDCKESDEGFKASLDIAFDNDQIESRSDSILIGRIGSDETKSLIVLRYKDEKDLKRNEAYMLGSALDSDKKEKKKKMEYLVDKYNNRQIENHSEIILLSQLFKNIQWTFKDGTYKCIIEKKSIDTGFEEATFQELLDKCMQLLAYN